jgi:hypothetical protein
VKHFFFAACHALRWVVGLWLSCWLLTSSALAAGTGPALPGAGATPSLAEALNPDGTLRAGAQGSFDARHFVLHTAPDGRPSFSPASPLGAGDENWQDNFRLPGTDGTVYVVLPVGSAVYIGGAFTKVGGIKANFIAKWDGTQWSALGVGVSGAVSALCASGTDLYVATSFYVSGGVASGVSKWNGTSWTSLAGNALSTKGANPVIKALAVTGTSLYVGGLFDTIGGVAANNIARWDGATWNTLGTGTTNGTSYQVCALAIIGNDMYVGGSFTSAGGLPANNLARWDGTAWNLVGTGADNGVNQTVLCLVAVGTDLYAGGVFSKAGSVTANSIAKWSNGTWSSFGTGTSNGVSPTGGVYSLAVSGTTVYVGGGFTYIGGNQVGYGVARWDGSAWNVMGTTRNPGLNANSFFVYAFSLALVGNNLYAGGTFVEAGDAAAKYIARWDGTAWNAVGANANGVDSDINTVAISGTDVYVGGAFSSVGNVPANRIAKWDGTRWSALLETTTVGSYNGIGGSGVTGRGTVYALAVSGATVYAAGFFAYAGAAAVNNIAKWDGAHWSALSTGLITGTNPTNLTYVYTLAVAGTTLYAGGTFTTAGGLPANYVAKWNGTAWGALGTGSANGTNATVYALATSGASVYAGGNFTTAGGLAANRVAKWDGTTWSTLGTGATNGLSGGANALATSGTDLYVGGTFATAGGVTVNNIARWDGTTWNSLGAGPGMGVNGTVLALSVSGTNVYAGGTFTRAGGALAARVAKWNGSTWSTFGTGLNATVRSLAAGPGALVNVGGLFTTVGDESKFQYAFGVYNDGTTPLATQSANVTDLALAVYPNPTFGGATLTYQLPAAATVSAEVVDAVGRPVATILPGATQAMGSHTLTVPALQPGLYLVHLRCNGKSAYCQLVVE